MLVPLNTLLIFTYSVNQNLNTAEIGAVAAAVAVKAFRPGRVHM